MKKVRLSWSQRKPATTVQRNLHSTSEWQTIRRERGPHRGRPWWQTCECSLPEPSSSAQPPSECSCHYMELKNHPAGPCLKSWLTEQWEIINHCCSEPPGCEVTLTQQQVRGTRKDKPPASLQAAFAPFVASASQFRANHVFQLFSMLPRKPWGSSWLIFGHHNPKKEVWNC